MMHPCGFTRYIFLFLKEAPSNCSYQYYTHLVLEAKLRPDEKLEQQIIANKINFHQLSAFGVEGAELHPYTHSVLL